MPRYLVGLPGAIALAWLYGCSGAAERSEAVPAWEEFLASVPRAADGAYLVEEDIAIFGEARLRAYYDRQVARARAEHLAGREPIATSRAALKVHVDDGGADSVWPHAQLLTYCVEPSFGDRYGAVRDALRAATRSWSERLNVQFAEVLPSVADCQGTLVLLDTPAVFHVVPLPPGGVLPPVARSFLPDEPLFEGNTFAHTLQISDIPFTSTSEDDELEGLLRHELGHILGFRHEDTGIFWGSSRCSGDSDEPYREVAEPATSPDPTASGVYDEASVMMPPRCFKRAAGPPRQSEIDYAGGVRLYGLAPGLVASVL